MYPKIFSFSFIKCVYTHFHVYILSKFVFLLICLLRLKRILDRLTHKKINNCKYTVYCCDRNFFLHPAGDWQASRHPLKHLFPSSSVMKSFVAKQRGSVFLQNSRDSGVGVGHSQTSLQATGHHSPLT